MIRGTPSPNKLADELFENFEEITGHEKEEMFNEDGSWNTELLQETTASLVQYCKEQYDVDIRNIPYDYTLEELDRQFIHSNLV